MVVEQTKHHCLQFPDILNRLNRVIDPIFERLRLTRGLFQLPPVNTNLCLYFLLANSELINDHAEVFVGCVHVLQLAVHLVGLVFHSSYFLFSRHNVSLQFFNFKIKDELELFKLLVFPF
jgi:hypothetical protein